MKQKDRDHHTMAKGKQFAKVMIQKMGRFVNRTTHFFEHEKIKKGHLMEETGMTKRTKRPNGHDEPIQVQFLRQNEAEIKKIEPAFCSQKMGIDQKISEMQGGGHQNRK